jgi:hypothetical protein
MRVALESGIGSLCQNLPVRREDRSKMAVRSYVAVRLITPLIERTQARSILLAL